MAEIAIPLSQRLETLASFEPGPFPVLSLYLDLSPNQHGQGEYDAFVRKVLPERARGFAEESPERESFDNDAARIRTYLETGLDRSLKGVAIFACGGAGLFETIELDAPVGQHWLFVSSVPHLYPLARLMDQYRRYAAVLLDTNRARIFVFGLGSIERAVDTDGVKTRRHSKGGWSQARYQRHIDNYHLQHIKEVIATLDALVRDEGIDHIVAAGPDDGLNLLREHLPDHLAGKLEATAKMAMGASDADVLAATLESFRQKDAETDAERVDELKNAWRSGGLGVAGPEATLRALEMGQADELIVTGSPDALKRVQRLPDDAAPGPVQADTSAPQGPADEARLKLAGELIARAQQTGASIRFIEDTDLLADIGGVGALLRFRI